MTTKTYDIGIIGSGPAGLAAAFAARRKGLSVVIFEKYLWGGTCPNYGCDPKKNLVTAAQRVEQANHLQGFGVQGTVSLNWADLQASRRAYVDAVKPRKLRGLEMAGIDHVYGTAQFISSNEIKIEEDESVFQATDWVIAVGQKPKPLAISGGEFSIDSEAFLKLDELPDELTFIGGGYIGMEFATIAAIAGKQVHLISQGETVLEGFDAEQVTQVIDHLRELGAQFYLNVEPTEIVQTATGYQVHLSDGQTLTSQIIVNATGRIGNFSNLALAQAGVEYSSVEIPVDEYMQTNIAHIYAVGDAAGAGVPKLVPTGHWQGSYVIEQITSEPKQPISYPTIPTVVFTSPRLAEVGTLPHAMSGTRIVDKDMSQVITFYRNHEQARIKSILNQQGEMLGASVVSEDAEELINYFVTAINEKWQMADQLNVLNSYPSLGSDMPDYF